VEEPPISHIRHLGKKQVQIFARAGSQPSGSRPPPLLRPATQLPHQDGLRQGSKLRLALHRRVSHTPSCWLS